jgi:hypothetical protein
METFAQLMAGGGLSVAEVNIADAPDYKWRGIMLDAGATPAPPCSAVNRSFTCGWLHQNSASC